MPFGNGKWGAAAHGVSVRGSKGGGGK